MTTTTSRRSNRCDDILALIDACLLDAGVEPGSRPGAEAHRSVAPVRPRR